jgi:hypothetical protein
VTDLVAAHEWIRGHVEPTGPPEIVSAETWATVARVPLADGVAWFKECAPVQTFEIRLSADLSARWPDRVGDVLAHDEGRRWMLLADAGRPVGEVGNPPEAWLAALPPYAELQRGEAGRVEPHLASSVPDRRLATLAADYDALLRLDLPIEPDEARRLRDFAPTLATLADELAGAGVPETVQHDDLHMANLFEHEGSYRVLDWGDACIGHPFTSLVVTFRFLEERAGLAPGDPWYARLRDAYLEPWDAVPRAAVDLALRVGTFSRAVAYPPYRAPLTEEQRADFDPDFAIVLRRALARTTS